MRTLGINGRDQERRALAKYDYLREQGLAHSEAVQHAAIYYGVLNARVERLLAQREASRG